MGEGVAYLTPEAKARLDIDAMLEAAGWAVQDADSANLSAAQGVAVREFILQPHGRADYLLFVDGKPVGVLEAKQAGTILSNVEPQRDDYAVGMPDYLEVPIEPLPFTYMSTGTETRFKNGIDPGARTRDIYAVHRPETLAGWIDDHFENRGTLRHRLQHLPELDTDGLWSAQERAIRNLEDSLADNRPRALIQMATGSGKTYTAANIAYRLVRYGGAKRVLFLVDRANLGRQTLNEFQTFTVPNDGRKFTELYNVQHMSKNAIDPVARVTISTIQRLYSTLKGEQQLDEEVDEESAYDSLPDQPVEVAYNPKVPPETFDVVIVDECHRSIFGLWRQVLDYFDTFTIGLTATPNKQALGFFNQNLVMEYGHAEAVADQVNVDFDVYRIKTEISEGGSKVDAGLVVGFRDRQTRKRRWEKLDDEVEYGKDALDRAVVAEDQIRTFIETFRNRLFTEIFPGRTDVPKTLIFAMDDSHADDIIRIVREEFGKGDEFATKITYKTTGRKPDELLRSFRNTYFPRIAVTV
ncbi:MAG: DEAD/DEAH box helicase family protein, partial [Actinomycetota bacterium]|nr:DEAD/DEAH box helicase family protein [Actinomycetota bacterium]